MTKQAIQIHPQDNVAVALQNLNPGQTIWLGDRQMDILSMIPQGHKFAIDPIQKQSVVRKYANPIGKATQDIKVGEHVHSHNLKTGLGEILEYIYQPVQTETKNTVSMTSHKTFKGYLRTNGKIGIRNELWVIPTVGCINQTAKTIVDQFKKKIKDPELSVSALTHPYGCSQLGDDHGQTQNILCGLAKHPNAGGVLILGLGCENNQISQCKALLKDCDTQRIRFVNAQDVEDEIQEGVNALCSLYEIIQKDKRESFPWNRLVIGMKCGGSDAFSGITANPLLGFLSDVLTEQGGSIVLTEVPEMFGAEHLLMNRCVDQSCFESAVGLINNFKKYFSKHDQPIYENPSPGNKEGGITTLEEKSLGCIQKGGQAIVTDILQYSEQVKKSGLTLLNGPGNDLVSSTALAAAHCHMVLFTTGRGTPFGTIVPTMKISTQTSLFEKKPHWIDFDAGTLLTTSTLSERTQDLIEYVCKVASGEFTWNEKNGYKEIAIFKNGITL